MANKMCHYLVITWKIRSFEWFIHPLLAAHFILLSRYDFCSNLIHPVVGMVNVQKS